jgi:alpha-glucosidase
VTAAPWWQRGAVYQVYPRSFADADGDGVGDLRGLRARLDHLAELRVEAVWLSPIFPSPMADFGYDVADYCDVDPLFGTLEDLDRLIADCHARGIRVILDWVPNHTSDRHPWFEESRSSRDNPRREWYVWRDPAPGGGPPNDWESVFPAVGPAWTLDERTGQYYLHSFMREQPDLDWENPEVREAMHDVLRFWLDRGVDGFRLDAIARIAKDPELGDNDGTPNARSRDWPSIHGLLRGIRAVVDEYDDRLIVGEVSLEDLRRTVSYLEGGDQLHLVHNFVFFHLPWDAQAFRSSIDDFTRLADDAAWPAWFLENHDHPRAPTRFGGGALGAARARAVALMLYGLRGTPFVYQGQELGLPDAEIPPERVVDVDGRDPERAPIPWSADASGGWVDPWLPPVAGAEALSAERQASDSASMLALVRRLGALRAATPVLQQGEQRMVDAAPGVLAWIREDAGDRILVAVNFTDAPTTLPEGVGAQLLLSTDAGRRDRPVERLGPSEAVFLRLAC